MRVYMRGQKGKAKKDAQTHPLVECVYYIRIYISVLESTYPSTLPYLKLLPFSLRGRRDTLSLDSYLWFAP